MLDFAKESKIMRMCKFSAHYFINMPKIVDKVAVRRYLKNFWLEAVGFEKTLTIVLSGSNAPVHRV